MSHSYYKEAPAMSVDGQVVLQYTLPQQTGEHLDTHTCNTCDVHFTSIEDYLQHKQVHHLVQKQGSEVQSMDTSQGSEKIKTVGNHFGVLQVDKIPSERQEKTIPGENAANGNVVHVQVENIAQVNMTSEGSEKIRHGEKPVLLLVQQPSASNLVRQDTSGQQSLHAGNTQKKKYKCSVCNRLLKDYSTWKAHKLTHTEQREWVCQWEDCTYAFKTKGSLKRHMRRHTDERPFMCEFCQRSFRESGALTRHLKARTPCTVKTDADFPKYGKNVSFSQNIPAAVNKGLPQELDATTLLPIAQEAGPVPEKLHPTEKSETVLKQSHFESEQAALAERSIPEVNKSEETENKNTSKDFKPSLETLSNPTQFTANQLVQTKPCQDIGKILSAVPNAHKVHVKRVKVLTVIDSNTGKKMKIAVPISSKIIPIVESKAITSKEEVTKKLLMNSQFAYLETVCKTTDDTNRSNQVQFSSLEVESSKNVTDPMNKTGLSNNADTESKNNSMENKELKTQNLENNLSLEEEKCEIETMKYKVDENNVVHKDVEINREFEDNDNPDGFEEVTEEFTEETTDGDFTTKNSPGEFISDESNDINSTTVTVMNEEDVNYFDLEDSQTSSEIQMSTEVVTSGDFGSEPVATQCEENLEAMDIDQEQGVPLTNKKKCLACGIYTKDEEPLKLHLKTHLIPAGYKCPVTTCKYIAKEKKRLALHLKITHHGQVKVSQGEKGEHDTDSTPQETERLIMACESVEDSGPEENDDSPDAETTDLANVALRQLLELQGNLDTQVLLTNDNQTVGVLHNCPVCERTFTLNYLKLHIRAHTGEKPYSCTHCDKRFRTKDTLTKHMSSHSDVRNYKCGECGKMFKRISHAREHLKVHSQERPYICTLCDKAFKSANCCKVHLRTHSEYLPHKCKVCPKRFREKSGLDRHTRTHTGEKPFKCKLCGRGFAEHGTLSRHLKAKVPCTTPSKKYLKDNENHMENIQAHLDTLNKLKQDFAMVDPAAQGTSNIPNQMWIDNQVEIEPNDSNEVQTTHTGDISLVIATGNGHTSGGDTVLTEFSTMVTDTQEYIVSHKDIQVVNLTEMTEQAPEQYTEHTQEGTFIDTKFQQTGILDPNAQYIVTSSSDDFITFKNIDTSEEITVKPEQLQQVQSTENNTVINNSSAVMETS